MNEFIPDMTQRFPDAGEPAEEKEYLVSVTVPMTVEVRVTAVDEDEAKKEAKEELEKIDIRRHIEGYDLSEMEFEEVEQI